MKIGVAGIGGIGSNVARLLAQAGVSKIRIVDRDHVVASDLNRHFYRMSQVGKKKTLSLAKNLKEIFPDMAVDILDMDIRPGDSARVFSDCDIVVEGFDDKTAKKMIIEELGRTGKFLVSASGIAGPDLSRVQVRKIGNCHVVGDLMSDQDDFEVFGPKIILVAALMAAIVLNRIREGIHEG